MSIQTNLTVSPYFDDYNDQNDYYKILFKPATAVQVRELNQLQTLLQKQTEQFGDHILKAGTILTGCQFSFQTAIPYVKINDITAKGAAVNVNEYVGLFVKNSSNLVSKVIDVAAGFEAQDPNVNTLYLNYLNSGDSLEEDTYVSGELTIYSNDFRLYNVNVLNASQRFSNSDAIVLLSAIEVQNTAGGLEFANGTFQVNELITQDTTGAQAIILSVNATANSDALVLRIKPLTTALASGNAASWNFKTDFNIVSNTTNNEAVLAGFVGREATANFSTTFTGAIRNVSVNFQGRNYYVPPFVTITSTTASQAQINTLNLVAENFKEKVTVATEIASNATGYAYGVSVTSGTIYQKGHFLRVNPQFAIVDKYANTPDNVAVGFVTEEAIVNSSIDSTLLDNSAGFLNRNAPGADRLQLTPKIATKTFAEAEEDNQFLPLVKFSQGKHFIINNVTQFDKLGDELARRTFEESGNYVLDTFNVTTRSPTSIANSDTTFTYVIDPGHAYIGGYRVRTERTFSKNVDKSTDTKTVENTSSDIQYGNYLRVNQFAGLHAFTTGQQISLRNTARRYITNTLGNITAAGSEIGKARIRSVTLESGIPGTPTAIYRLYLFDIRMNAGRNFKNVRSIFATSGVLNGVGDAVLETSANEVNPIAVIKEKDKNTLIVDTKLPLFDIDNVRYIYRTITNDLDVTTAGVISIPSQTSAEWPYSGALSRAEKQELIVVPEGTLTFNTALSGTFASRTLITGSVNSRLTGSNTQFASQLKGGDYVVVNHGANTAIVRIESVANNTSLIFGPNNALDSISGGASITRVYPTGIPIPVADDTAITVSVVGSNLEINLNNTLTALGKASVVYNQRTEDALSVSKTVTRKAYVKIQANTHPQTTQGPWCVGHSDIIRLRGVYLGSNTAATNAVEEFYIDHNQNENYYDVGYLYRKKNSNFTVGADAVLLVEFDVLTHDAEGIKTINSYNVNDTLSLSDMDTDGTVINTIEIPELITRDNTYHDLRECLDFRPKTANTVVLQTNAASAPLNPAEPSESTRFSSANKRFPAPETDVFYDMTHYLPRIDNILVNSKNEFEFLIGRELSRSRTDSREQLLLYRVLVPPYPSLPSNLSTEMLEIAKTNVANETFINERRKRYTIISEKIDRQTKGYTMERIAVLENRIAALEFNMNLTQLEDSVRARVIPSSLDSTLDRFKFGFFVDNFSDSNFTDLNNPEHNSTIYGFVLQPARVQFNLSLKLDDDFRNLVDKNVVRFPYVKKKLLSQPSATTGPIVADPPEEPSVGKICQFVINQNNKSSLDATIFEQYTFTLSSNSSADGLPVTLKFNVFNQIDRFEIYQSNDKSSLGQQIYNNSTADIQSLTEEEKRVLDTKGINPARPWIKSRPLSFSSKGTDPKFWLRGAGKFEFPYDFSRGRYITLRNIKGSPNHSYYVCYPSDSYEDAIYSSGGGFSPPPPPPPPPPGSPPPQPVATPPQPVATPCTRDTTFNQKCQFGNLVGTLVLVPRRCVIEFNAPECVVKEPDLEPILVEPIEEEPTPVATEDSGAISYDLGQLGPLEANTIATISANGTVIMTGGSFNDGTVLDGTSQWSFANRYTYPH
jgi:hypothetical protein